MSSAAPARPATRIGRFLLRRELGRGAQASVWLAHDGRLEREVALKLLHEAAPGDAAHAWLDEARAVSRLHHPAIVPVFEADLHQGRPYLVFEYVAGGTLAQRLLQGPLPWREALGMICSVLDALQVAHDAGVVHRDLKPSNIMLDAQGRARVMDFGIAARVASLRPSHRLQPATADGEIVGSPGYISPEAARGAPAAASMDVFSAALLLAEMLSGQPLRPPAGDVLLALRRAEHEAVRLPDSLGERGDAHLRALLAQALALDPALRPASARALREALSAWLEGTQPSLGSDAALGVGLEPSLASTAQGTMEFLWRRMRHKADFPALGDSLARIHRVASSDQANLASLSAEIMKDVALTHKLLRLVNSAGYCHAGGGTISTVSRAVALVGMTGIRNMALSLVLLEHLQDKAQAQQLMQDILRALMAATLASELAATPRESEEVFIGALFQNLGRLLAGYYFAEEAAQVRALALRMGEAAAATQVLGLDYTALGVEVARRWGLPESLLQLMRRPAGEPPGRSVEAPGERQCWLAAAANDMSQTLLEAELAAVPFRLQALATRYARSLGLTGPQVSQAVSAARGQMSEFVHGCGLSLPLESPVRRLLPLPPDAPDPLAPQTASVTLTDADVTALLLAEGEAAAPPTAFEATVRQPAPALATPPPQALHAALATGVAEVTQALVNDPVNLSQVLNLVLGTLQRAAGFSRVVFCLRDARGEALTGRLALGPGAEPLCQAFRVAMRQEPGQRPDLLAAVCQRAADTYIADACHPTLAGSLPAWLRQPTPPASLLILPLTLKQATFALIYADVLPPGALALGEPELAMLRSLRNQAVLAFRQVT